MNAKERQAQEGKTERRLVAGGRALDGGLAAGVERAGGELLGYSFKVGEYDTLLTLRAVFPAGRMIAFVGGDTALSALVKAVSEAKADSLRWREDRFAK
jgi:hypothetical protein